MNNIVSNIVQYLFHRTSPLLLNSIFYLFYHIFISYYLCQRSITNIVIIHTILYSLCFIFRRPLLSTVKNIFTMPFQRNVWIAIATFLVLVFCLLYISMKWEHYRSTWKKSTAYWNQLNVGEPTIIDNLLVLLGAFAQQGIV